MASRSDGLRLFGWYALASAVPIIVLGFGLGRASQTQMNRRALDQAASEANTIADAGIEPALSGRDLTAGLTPSERAQLSTTTAPLMSSGSALRLRLRDRVGTIVFDAAHPEQSPRPNRDDDVETAASGRVVRKLTRLNRDEVDAASQIGARAVEAYIPVHAYGTQRRVIGVLEIYLPYAPIARAFAGSEHAMLVLIAGGLVVLWLALSAITWSVTRRLRRTAAANAHLALHDTLTGLPNRTLFTERAAHAIAAAGRGGDQVGVAIVDLDRFKEINDTLGHHNGDAYLRHVATTLTAALRPGDTVARLGGDEFGLVLSGVDGTTAHSVLERVQRGLARDLDLDGIPVSAEASIGIAFWPHDATDLAELLQCADLAMYTAKESRAAIVEYSPDLVHFTPARLALVSELRHAITAGELRLHYQPKLELRTRRIVGVEALVRWQHPARGLLTPNEFLDVAETTGLIGPLTGWVIDNTVAQLADWHAQGLTLNAAINVSARNLRDDSLPERILARLAASDVAPHHLEIEITETALIADPARAVALLQRLRDNGVRVSLDDFGQGYTSLAQLGRLPLAELKIDRAFVASMLANPNDRTIVSTVIKLGHSFGLEVVAEGAEDQETLAVLTTLGCDTAQGYALTPPLPHDQLVQWLREYPTGYVAAMRDRSAGEAR